jgi:peptidoglycan/LPS O-acetylase OafA/YrhL
LDVVRGIAILLVLVWHYLPRSGRTPEVLMVSTRLFWSGVDLFFVLSGFLIGGILLQNREAINYYSVFYLRRAARILPLYVVLLISFAALRYLDFDTFAASFQASLPFWPYLVFAQNYFYAVRNAFGDPWIDVTWSLAVEEQFYIFLSFFIWKLDKKWLWAGSIALVLLAPVLRFFSSQMWAYVSPLHRADALMLGVLLALAWSDPRGQAFLQRHAAAFRWLFPVFLAGLVKLTLDGISIGDSFGHLWMALSSACFIIIALTWRSKTSEFLFANPLLTWLGLRSYGIYLLHKPVLIVVDGIFFYFSLPKIGMAAMFVLSLLVLVLVSEASYRLFEKPILDLAQRRFKYKTAQA